VKNSGALLRPSNFEINAAAPSPHQAPSARSVANRRRLPVPAPRLPAVGEKRSFPGQPSLSSHPRHPPPPPSPASAGVLHSNPPPAPPSIPATAAIAHLDSGGQKGAKGNKVAPPPPLPFDGNYDNGMLMHGMMGNVQDENGEDSTGESEANARPLLDDDDDGLGSEEDDSVDRVVTNNKVLCLHDQVKKPSGNSGKWKVKLSYGVMTLSGHDFVFRSADGKLDF